MKIDSSLGFVFLQIANNFRVRLEKAMNSLGLHYGQIFILTLLCDEDGQSQINLALTLRLSQPTVNKMVKSLSENGFVSCLQCQKDGRLKKVFLTPKGEAVQQQIWEQMEILENDFFVPLSDTEQLIFKQLFDRLKENAFQSKVSN